MPTKRRFRARVSLSPISKAAWLWALGREDEARRLEPYIRFVADEQEPEIWENHGEALTREWQRDHPGSKPPIQVRLERAAERLEAARRWRERSGEK